MTTDAAFEVLTVPPPALSGDDAADILSDHYNIAGKLRPLTSERDQNFVVATASGEQFVLKISNSAEVAAVTDLQTAALLHIAETMPELPVPRLVHTVNGDSILTIVAADRRPHRVRVLTWLDGVPIRRAEWAPECAATLGTCLARLGHALRNFEHAAADYALLWDLKRAVLLRDLLEYVGDTALRALCERRLDVFETRVLPKLDDVRWQVIHNDLNPSNVLVDAQDARMIKGIIDFGDIVRSPLIVDIAVAAAYLMRDKDDVLEDVLAFVAAYCEVEPLEPAEIDLLFDLILTRSAMTILITHWRVMRYPENREYIVRSETGARKMLERMSGVFTQDVTARLRDACDLH
ncbi:MAG: phosphotransferase [Gammaproteobacteria bacterium]|nr:phosphotransferase [Gammaproteobacteria bacterium]